MVRKEGLEPSRCYPQVPETCASTSSATFAGSGRIRASALRNQRVTREDSRRSSLRFGDFEDRCDGRCDGSGGKGIAPGGSLPSIQSAAWLIAAHVVERVEDYGAGAFVGDPFQAGDSKEAGDRCRSRACRRAAKTPSPGVPANGCVVLRPTGSCLWRLGPARSTSLGRK